MRKRLPRTVLRVVVAEALAQEASVLPAHSSRAVAAMEPHTECAGLQPIVAMSHRHQIITLWCMITELPDITHWDGYRHSMRPLWVQTMANTPH
uniref:Putative secreted peptide n=1 Tax=Anopheles braziliensis TaxID=58242 RepID=A0A2M3ZV74_9DIPT